MPNDSPSMQRAHRTNIAALINEIGSSDPLVRKAAAHDLGRNGPRAASAMVQLSNIMKSDNHFDVRLAAASAAWLIDPTSEQPVKALDDELQQLLRGYDDVLRRAEAAPDSPALDGLFDVLRQLGMVIQAVGEIGPAAAGSAATLVKILTLNIGDGYMDLVPRIAHSLGEMGPSANAVLPSLEAYLDTWRGKQNRSEIVSAIQGIAGTRRPTPVTHPPVDPDLK